MKSKQIVISGAVILTLAVAITAARFYADRRAYIAAYQARIDSFRWAHNNLVDKGPDRNTVSSTEETFTTEVG